MIPSQSSSKEKVVQYLKKHAPYSIVDLGKQFADNGFVGELSKSGNKIQGIVKDANEITHTGSLAVVSSQEIEAECTCCTTEEMHEQWCPHAVALFWRSCELGFFDAHSGFPSHESTYRMNTSSSHEIAAVINDVSRVERKASLQQSYYPKVKIHLDLSTDRLGVCVYFEGEPQIPTIFEGFSKASSRALDNILLRLLDEEGSWDEDSALWYVNSSNSIEVVLGIIQEYKDVSRNDTHAQVKFSDHVLEAKLQIEWREAAVELGMLWLLPDGTTRHKEGELLGTGPYWTMIDDTIYKVSPTASRIASIFPYSASNTLPRSQVAPILEVIRETLYDPSVIEIINPELQPQSEIKSPVPVLELARREQQVEHFTSQHYPDIEGTLRFEYPTPKSDQNIVYLPNRQQEKEYADHLRSIGFESTSDKRRFVISGDQALDFIQNGKQLFSKTWQLDGYDVLRKGTRFSELNIKVTMSAAVDTDGGSGSQRKPNWFDCHISLVQNNANVPLSTIFKQAKSDTDRWIHLDGGSYARVPGGTIGSLKTTLGMLDSNFKLSNTIKNKLTTAQAISLSRIEDPNFSIGLDPHLTALSRKLKDFMEIPPIKPSKSFVGKLRIYQEEGLRWLNFLNEFELGGILADEMGLGKTVQTLALFQLLKESRTKSKKLDKPALIVAPTSVITNWSYEAKRFTPGLKVLLLHGPQRKQLFNSIPDYDLVITSYALLRLDRYDLERHEFSYCVLDEAQNIKNPQAATTKAAKNIKADRRLALTGTPTENRPLELWSIVDFLMPGYLGSHEFFKSYIERPILDGTAAPQVIRLLNAKTKPFLLRRTKAEVEKELPPKVESVLHVDMTTSQMQLYAQILEEVRPRVFDAIEKKGVRGASVSILAALLRLRQVCNHPNSIDALKEIPGYESGKFNLLKELVEEALEIPRKILLFSQFREMLAIIRRWLDEKGVNYLYLDGATTKRQELIDQFNNDEKVRLFLISLKAGGTGLNLTAADTVVIYDPWWNPAVESQAVDRAHRIGQSKRVSVYRLVTENSVEQKIMDLKSKKAKMVDALINENGLSTVSLTKADLENLFSPFPMGS